MTLKIVKKMQTKFSHVRVKLFHMLFGLISDTMNYMEFDTLFIHPKRAVVELAPK